MIEEFETMKTWEKIVVIILFSVPIIIIAFLIGIVSVNAMGISEFSDVTNFAPLPTGLEMTTNPDISNSSNTFLNSQHNYTGLNIDISDYNYIAIPFNSAWIFQFYNTCHWGSAIGNSTDQSYWGYGGGCTYSDTKNYTMRVWLTYTRDGQNTSQFCDYDGQLAICNVKNIDTITAVNIALYYSYNSISIGSTRFNATDYEFKFQSRLGRAWFYMNSTQVASDIDAAIDRNIQSQQEQAERIIESQQEIMNYGEDVEPDEPSEDIQESNEREEELLSDIEELDLSDDIDIDLEQNSTNWVWTQLTNILQTNAKIFGLIISTLVLSVIKTILGR